MSAFLYRAMFELSLVYFRLKKSPAWFCVCTFSLSPECFTARFCLNRIYIHCV